MDNMKNIKELGLELIELEDQFLLVKKVDRIEQYEWYVALSGIGVRLNIPYRLMTQAPFGNSHIRKIITSTKQLEGLPLLVIEDEVEKMAINSFGHKPSKEDNDILLSLGKGYIGGFKEGYNKAKSTYKFTEEDIWYIVYLFLKKVPDAIDVRKEIENLTKKELWIEVEFKETKWVVFRESDNAPYGKYEPKITNGKIKAIWK